MPSRADVVRTARTWLHTRFHHQQSRKGVGCDCIGLIAGVALELGIPEGALFRADATVRGYGRTPEPKMLRAAVARYLEPVATPLPGDILLMRFETDPQHFALVSAPDYMIHAYARARRVVENRIDDLWRSRIVRAYAFRGIG